MRVSIVTTVTNEYLSDEKWDLLHAAIADKLLAEDDRQDAVMQDHARTEAAILLAHTGVCFESMRADMGDDLPDAA